MLVMIADARNNRPTKQQLTPNLTDGKKADGATIIVKISEMADKNKFKIFAYSRNDSGQSSSTWGGARSAFHGFAKRIAKRLKENKLQLDGETVRL